MHFWYENIWIGMVSQSIHKYILREKIRNGPARNSPVCQASLCSLHWRHNDRDGVYNHQPHSCLLNCLFRRRSKKISKLRATGLWVGNSPGPVNSPHKWPVTRKMFPFDDVIMLYEWYLVVSFHRWTTLLLLGQNGKGIPYTESSCVGYQSQCVCNQSGTTDVDIC